MDKRQLKNPVKDMFIPDSYMSFPSSKMDEYEQAKGSPIFLIKFFC